MDDLFNIFDEVLDIAHNWKHFGLALHLPPQSVELIASKCGMDPKVCLEETLREFLKMNYDWKKYGQPSWTLIVSAVAHPGGAANEDLALKIAERHPGKEG